MREVVVGTERFKTTSYGTLPFCCGLLFFLPKAMAESTIGARDLCNGSITGFDEEPKLDVDVSL